MKILPEHPSLDHLRREARHLKSKHKNRDKSVSEIIGHYDISLHGLSGDELFAEKFSILDAQRVIARQYSFSSWAKLKVFVHASISKDSIVFNEKLRAEILSRNEQLTNLIELAKAEKGRNGTYDELCEYGISNARFLNPVFDKYGWPGPDIIGRDGDACFMLAASAHCDSAFQAKTASY